MVRLCPDKKRHWMLNAGLTWSWEGGWSQNNKKSCQSVQSIGTCAFFESSKNAQKGVHEWSVSKDADIQPKGHSYNGVDKSGSRDWTKVQSLRRSQSSKRTIGVELPLNLACSAWLEPIASSLSWWRCKHAVLLVHDIKGPQDAKRNLHNP